MAKRHGDLPRARKLYQRAHQWQPLAMQTWIEHAKLEEECGELIACQNVLAHGMLFCGPQKEGLLIKGLKLQERMGQLDFGRSLIASLKHVRNHLLLSKIKN